MSNPIRQDLIERVARMLAYDVPREQIAEALAVKPEHVQQVSEMDETRELVSQYTLRKFEVGHTLNSAWDDVEALALGHVVEAMRETPDAEFALKVATMANKADRRGAKHNQPITPGNAGARVHITLPMHFVQHLQNPETQLGARRTVATQEPESGEEGGNKETPALPYSPADVTSKDADFMASSKLEAIFDGMRNRARGVSEDVSAAIGVALQGDVMPELAE